MTSESRFVVYHNPRCSKSRRALELLRERGVEPLIVLYLEEPPTAEDVKRLATLLDEPVSALARTSEAAWSELGLSVEAGDDALAAALAANPILLERPIVVHGDRAEIGRPPENVLRLL